MATWNKEISVRTPGRGLHVVTRDIERALAESGVNEGILNIHLAHTSASLLIQENADPTARKDLEEFFDRLAPEGESWHRHLAEGPDDTVSHLRASVLPTALNVPVAHGQLRLGTWQGIYVVEHRRASHTRKLWLTLVY